MTIDMESFFDELALIKEAAQKCREGTRPIRASTLAKKDKYDGRGKRTTKLAFIPLLKDILGAGAKAGTKAGKVAPEAAEAAKPFLSAEQKLIGAGGLAGGVLGKNEWDKYMLGRRYYEAQNR